MARDGVGDSPFQGYGLQLPGKVGAGSYEKHGGEEDAHGPYTDFDEDVQKKWRPHCVN